MKSHVKPLGTWAAVALLGVSLVGCDRDVRLAGKHLRDVEVRTVSHYGVTLDESATPEQVAYVLLRAIREDFLAEDAVAREAALDVQFDVCAADRITATNNTQLSRNELLYKIVHLWTPTLDHYVSEFETSWEKAKQRFVRLGSTAPQTDGGPSAECQVVTEVADPAGDPNGGALVVIHLVRDSGYWRVYDVGFAEGRRTLDARRATAPSHGDGTNGP